MDARIEALLRDVRLADEALHALVVQVRALALDLGDVTEAVKYGGILFSRARPFGGVFAYAAHVTVEFSQGALLQDPHGVLEGGGKLRRHVRLQRPGDVEARHVAHFLRLAAAQEG